MSMLLCGFQRWRFDWLYVGFVLICLPLLAQEKVKKTETIATTIRPLTGKIKINESQGLEIKGTVVYTLTSANPENTVTGNLTYTFPEPVRQKIAQALQKNLKEIPVNVTVKDVGATLEKQTHCPQIRLEFAPQEIPLPDAHLSLERFVLSIGENRQNLSRALCIWTEHTSKGTTNYGIVQYINLLLKGEEEEQKSNDPKPF